MFKRPRRWRAKIATVPTYTAPLKEKKERYLFLLNWQLFTFSPFQTQWSHLHEIQHLKCFCTTCHIIFYNFDHNNAITNLTFVFLAISIMWQRRIDRCLGIVLFTVACESLGTPCRICENVNNFNKIREIIQNACYFLFSTVLSKIFYIKYVYI